MKNSKLFPFERNKYYYGKLLSVNDFEMEQKYINDKRRSVNRLLFGSGVAAGMYVLQVDDFSVSVERGLALDYSGREIVIDNPVIKKLSLIDGYDTYARQNQGYVYLCLEYDEKDAEPVYNVAGKNTAVQDADYNKIHEGYHLFLTDAQPEQDHLSIEDLYTDTQTIYWDNGIRIRQSISRFAASGGQARLKVEVENMGQQQLFAFSYNLNLTCMSCAGKPDLKVSFNEAFYEKSGRYELNYILEVHDVDGAEGVAELDEDSFKLSIQQHQMPAKAAGRQSVKISKMSEALQLKQSYYQESMESFLRNNYQQSIYLAKIFLIQAGESYMIEKIENMPFNQYVAGNELMAAAMSLMAENRGFSGMQGASAERFGALAAEHENGMRFAQGEEVIHLGERAIRGRRFFSGEISHGLGLGRATVILSVVDDQGVELYGSSEVFEDTEPMVELAARLNREKGSFVIGVRPLTETMKSDIRIHWTVIKDMEAYAEEKKERRIFIKPNVLNLHTRESYYLEAVCSNLKDKRLKWSVKDNCGTIDHNGMYTAPNMTGVFEVTAQSVAYPQVRASIFVIVREEAAE